MLYGDHDTPVFLLLVLPALVFWIVALVRVSRARDPRDHDGRRMEVDEVRVLAAQRLHRRALLLLVAASVLSMALRIVV